MKIALVMFLAVALGVSALTPTVNARARRKAAPAAAPRKAQRIAIWRIDPLGGLPPEIVARLESLLTMEMGRIVGDIVPSLKTRRVQRKYRRLRRCQGANYCLGAIGDRLRATGIVAGTLASLGEDYVVTLKLVDVKTRRATRRITETLSGNQAQLIEAVRVAAYRLLDPKKLTGSLQILVNKAGATIYLSGKRVGVSPLRHAVSGLKVKTHTLRIAHPDHLDFIRKVKVRFQKTSIVKVKLKRPRLEPPTRPPRPIPPPPIYKDLPTPWYSKWWFWTIVGAVVVGAGAAAGMLLPRLPYTPKNCDAPNDCTGGN